MSSLIVVISTLVTINGDAINASAALGHDERLSAGRSQAVGKLQRLATVSAW